MPVNNLPANLLLMLNLGNEAAFSVINAREVQERLSYAFLDSQKVGKDLPDSNLFRELLSEKTFSKSRLKELLEVPELYMLDALAKLLGNA